MVHNHIERLKSKISEMLVKSQASEARLIASEERLEQQQRIIDRNAFLIQTLQTQQATNALVIETAQAEKLALNVTLESNSVLLQTAQAEHAALQVVHLRQEIVLANSQTESQERQEARDAFELEVAYLRDNNDALGLESTALKEERSARKKKESNAKRSVLRSFDWREDRVDASVLRGAVAFWGATCELVEDANEEQKRMSNKARQNILKVIVEQGFNGELHDDMEKAFVKKKRFKVFALGKKSDLESKFGGEAIGSIAHCENGHEKHMRGLMPSSTSVHNFHRKMNGKAALLGLSSMANNKTWCWGDGLGNQLREGVHRYVKSVYYNKWDTRVTADDPYIVVLTGDLARVNLKGSKCVTLCGAKECDHRLPSQKQSTGGHENNINQSRNLYVPAAAGYCTESDLMPLFEQLVELFVEIEHQKYVIVDGIRYDNVFIKVLIVADMMFLHKFTERGGCCASTTHFCMFCSCMSKFRNEGEPGGCDACRRDGIVYDTQGLQICLHHDMVTPEKKARQRQRQIFLEELLTDKMPPRKKPMWEDKAGLQRACLERCVPGVTNLDGRLSYRPGDLTAIPKMTIPKLNAWLDQRCEGITPTTFHNNFNIVCVPLILFNFALKGGCTLSNNPIVGVHNISESTLLKELRDRQIAIPPRPARHTLRTQGMERSANKSRSQRRCRTGDSHERECVADIVPLTPEHKAYVAVLRSLLVERLKLEEELERLTMYARDTRFDSDVVATKLEFGRVILDMLHCPMRMNEKVLFMLYFAAMNRHPKKCDWQPVLESMTTILRRIGDLPPSWSHTLKCKKSKAGVILKHKLEVFHMDFEASKYIFNYGNTVALYEVIDLALGPQTLIDPADGKELVNQDNLNWRLFIISYLNCLELLTLHRDYRPGEVDELERRCKKMYTLLVTKIGGLEAVTNYFHYVGSGHVVAMCRMWGNLWRYRNEGVEAFNKIVSLRHNKHNGNGGGRKRARDGVPIETCPEFWSLGQWLGRWSMWHLGYGDEMDPDLCPSSYFETPNPPGAEWERNTDCDSDDTYTTQSSSNAGVDDEVFSVSDEVGSMVSVEFVPCTPHDMPMIECRAHNLLHRRCVQ